METCSPTAVALAARKAATAATRHANHVTRAALREDPREAVTSPDFMRSLIPLLPPTQKDQPSSFFSSALDAAYRESIGETYSHFTFDRSILTIHLVLGKGLRSGVEILRESSELADFLSEASFALCNTQSSLVISVELTIDQRPLQKEDFQVVSEEGLTLRSSPTARGFIAKTHPSLRDALSESFTPISSGLVSFPDPID